MFLMIKFPRIHDDKVEYSVVHFEKVWFHDTHEQISNGNFNNTVLHEVIYTYQYNLLLNEADYDVKNFAECYPPKLRANRDNSVGDLHNSSCYSKAEFIKKYIVLIVIQNISKFLTMAMCQGMDCAFA